ncbi:Zn-ribbon domain-containing OB-fold protein [Aeromicrobium sp.]|uniref:Zn-ribbon domain-containing OB-fold protein n=1 Tax=Aeromicrobium sp. TaxID=1871063 RepID=UPI003D6A0BD1
MGEPRTLHAPFNVEFDYTRSLGATLSEFMTGLRRRQILGGVLSDGSVAVPPPEYDTHTLDPVTELVPVGDEGVVQSWAWVPEPVPGQPLDRPFAFAHVLLDGADRPLLHAVAVDAPDQVETGLRVRVRWAEETVGAITDIRWFEPLGAEPAPTPDRADGEPVTGIVSPVHLSYDFAASSEESAFFRGLADGRILGQRCPVCHKVYVPPRGACPVDGVPTTDEVELPDHGTVTTFCIVNVPFMGQKIEPPYVSAYVLLDGADIAFLHLILGVDAADVRMGMRVEAVWKPREEWGTTIENISHFEPAGEPDADYESYRVHL